MPRAYACITPVRWGRERKGVRSSGVRGILVKKSTNLGKGGRTLEGEVHEGRRRVDASLLELGDRMVETNALQPVVDQDARRRHASFLRAER